MEDPVRVAVPQSRGQLVSEFLRQVVLISTNTLKGIPGQHSGR
jgi:hypothetical protein